MTLAHDDIPIATLHRLFTYDPIEGVLRWRVSGTGRRVGRVAGSRDAKYGYIRVVVDGRRYPVHRLMWAMTHDAYPSEMIDHRDGDGTNNRLTNLRPATPRQNMQNRKAMAGAKSPLVGAHWDSERGRWAARIKHCGRTKHLGRFATDVEAHEAYMAAKLKFHDIKRETV